jgi:hypothetical protein
LWHFRPPTTHCTVSQIDKNLTESAFDCRKARLKRKNVIRLLGRPPISLAQGDCGYEFGGALRRRILLWLLLLLDWLISGLVG